MAITAAAIAATVTLAMRRLVLVATVAACNDTGDPAACFGVCGDGTVCTAGRCVVATDDTPEPEPDPDPATKSKRRRGGKRGAADKSGAEADAFAPVDDSDVREYDGNKTQVMDMKVGTERLDDELVRSHLRRLEPKFNGCIETAAQHSEAELRGGEIDFTFSITGRGKVDSVTVKAPPHLRVFGIVPCLRKALASYTFPSFDGATMGVDYSFTVG
jgi:hypothetical protein